MASRPSRHLPGGLCLAKCKNHGTARRCSIGLGLSEKSLGVIISDAQSAMVTPGWELEFWSPVAITAIIAVVLYVAGQNLGDASDPRTHV